jgi:hypothetical protein
LHWQLCLSQLTIVLKVMSVEHDKTLFAAVDLIYSIFLPTLNRPVMEKPA